MKEYFPRKKYKHSSSFTPKGKVTTCPTCGKEFYRYPSYVKRGKDKFCSKRCMRKVEDIEVRETYTCHSCSRELNKSMFGLLRGMPRGICKECRRLRGKANLYKITIEEVIRLETSPCEVCGSNARINIDHCHSSNAVRGSLCRDCNLALGHFRDSPELLHQAILYLKKFQT